MIRRLLITGLTGLIRGYQLIVSPWFAPTCRYYPSCSQYAIEAVKTQGPLRGIALAGWRLLRCNPWSSGGVDHVPARRPKPDRADRHVPESDVPPAVETSHDSHSSRDPLRVEAPRTHAHPSWRTLHGNL